MTDIMIDIETFGTDSNSVVVSISAVKFNREGVIGETFEMAPSILEQLLVKGTVMDLDTIEWWQTQNDEAKKSLTGIKTRSVPFVLNALSEYLTEESGYNLWGNGSVFDNVITENLFKRHGVTFPVGFWAHRDVRTLVDIAGINKEDYVFEGIKHNGLDDCRHQIKFCLEAFKEQE